jgi:hypothetical protein
MFQYGRIFLYYKNDEIGSMSPEVAWSWFYNLRADVRRNVRMRMEGADKGGLSGAIPPIRGYEVDKGEDGKSPWEKFNPFEEGSLGDRLNPFVVVPGWDDHGMMV